MNPLLSRLHPYPFERLRALTRDITPNPALRPISLGIGEPRHPTPGFIQRAITDNLKGLARYPATAGEPALREAFTAWVARRYKVSGSWDKPQITQLSRIKAGKGADTPPMPEPVPPDEPAPPWQVTPTGEDGGGRF